MEVAVRGQIETLAGGLLERGRGEEEEEGGRRVTQGQRSAVVG